MKKPTGNNIKLGVFVFTSAVLLLAGVYFIGQRQQMFRSTFHLTGIFRDICGLQTGNNIRFSGITIGVVENIEQITDSTVRVDMLINENTRKYIKKNATAIIGSDGLMGNKLVSILPGVPGAAIIANNDVIATIVPVSFDDIMGKIKVTADNAATISAGLADIVNNIHEGNGTIGKLFMDNGFANNLDKTLVNIRQGSGGFKRNMDAASHNFLLRGFLKKKKNKESDH
jgi:phospholipid/cholesterol/gamma-HCH transport system substrate-binding protein